MSLELWDQRVKLTVETKCVIEAMHKVTGKDKAEIIRELMHEMALKKLKEAKVMQALMRVEGIAGNRGAVEEDPE